MKLSAIEIKFIQSLWRTMSIWKAGDLYSDINLDSIYNVVKNYSNENRFNDNYINGHCKELLYINGLNGFSNNATPYHDLLFQNSFGVELKTRALLWTYNHDILHNSTISQCKTIKKGKLTYAKEDNFAVISYLFTQFRSEFNDKPWYTSDIKNVAGITAFVLNLDTKKIIHTNYHVYDEYIKHFGFTGGFTYTHDIEFIIQERKIINTMLSSLS